MSCSPAVLPSCIEKMHMFCEELSEEGRECGGAWRGPAVAGIWCAVHARPHAPEAAV